MNYFGLDLGDGESCVHWTRDASTGLVNVIPISGKGSFLSAIAKLGDTTIIGDVVKQTQDEQLRDVNVCFKRHFLDHDAQVDQIITDFVRGILAELRKNQDVAPYVDDEQNTCYIVGCPAGWKPEERERYRQLMIAGGMKNVRVVSESRAAFENALRSKENAIDTDMIEQTVLMIDIGSSTLDFAYVQDGNEYEVSTMGNILLGGGLMDEMIVLRSLEMQKETEPEKVREIQALLNESEAKKGKLMLAARELKEYYFEHEEDFLRDNSTLDKRVTLFGNGKIYRVMLQISPLIVEDYIISRPHPLLNGQSFESRLRDSLVSAYEQTRKQKVPDLVILTGGPSRMLFFQELCKKQFTESRIIISEKPEYDISRGLVFVGSVDESMTSCIKDIREYAKSSAVEKKIEESYPKLVADIAPVLSNAVVDQCVAPAFEEWKHCGLNTLHDFQEEVKVRVSNYMQSSDMKQIVEAQVKPWSEDIIHQVETDINAISCRHNVTFSLEYGTLTIKGKGGDHPPLTISFLEMIEAIVSLVLIVVMGMVCGGAGTALLVAGPLGFVLGAFIAVAMIVLGKGVATDVIMSIPIPSLLRGLFKTESILSAENREKIENSIWKGMQEDEKMKRDLIAQVGNCIDTAISKAANNVEKAMEL